VASSSADAPVFHVHKTLLAFRSTYFRELSEGPLQPEVYKLVTSGLICGWFVQWVYTDTVPEGTAKTFVELVNFYLLASRVCKNSRLEDLIMNRIRQHSRQGLEDFLLSEVINDCYERAEAKSPLRHWLVKYVAWNLLNKKHDAVEYRFSIEEGGSFAMDLILVLLDAASAPFPDPSREQECKYHKHAEGWSVLLGTNHGGSS